MNAQPQFGKSLVTGAISPPTAGWRGELELGFSQRGERTVLSRRRHLGPLLVQRPFYPEGGVCHTYVLHPPGGVAGGDDLNIWVDVEAGAEVLLTTPAAGKFYRCSGNFARQNVSLQVAQDAALEWLPQENILFSGSQVRIHTEINLASGARLLAWDLVCLGRPASGERFEQGHYINGLTVMCEGKPLLCERLDANRHNGVLTAGWGLRNQPVVGTLIANRGDPASTANLRDLCSAAILGAKPGETHGTAAVTLVGDLIVLRYLGSNMLQARELFERSWQLLRPAIFQRPACPPRIWST